MISRRAPRASRAVEKLQQLSLNSSAGIDCNKPHSDVKSVYAMKNLSINPDGSVSLRKPIVLNNRFVSDFKRVIPLSEGYYIAISDSGFLILDSGLNSVKFRIVWSDKYGTERVNEVPSGTVIPSTSLDIYRCTVADTASGAVLGNCKLFRTVSKFPGVAKDSAGAYNDIFDTKLYDSATDSDFSMRLVNVFYDAALYTWCVKVNIPAPDEYYTTDTGVQVSRNTLLDNPFATRDSYNVAVPSVKTIRAYAYTAKEAEGVVLADSLKTLTAAESLATVEDSRGGAYAESDNTINGNLHYRKFTYEGSGAYHTIAKLGNVELRLRVHVEGWYQLRQDSSSSGAIEQTVLVGQYVKASGSLIAVKLSEGTDITELPDFQITIPSNTWNFVGDHKFFNMSYGAGFDVALGTVTGVAYTSAKTITADTFRNSNNAPIMEFNFYRSGNLFSKDPAQVDAQALFYSNSTFSIRAYTSGKTFATLNYSYNTPEKPTGIRVADLTESVKNVRYRAMDLVDFDKLNLVVLKAFLGIPTAQFDDIYCSWRYTLDGVHWQDALTKDTGDVTVTENSQEPIKDISSNETPVDASFVYRKLFDGEYSNENPVASRADCLTLVRRTDADSTAWDAVAFKFKLVALEGSKVKATYGEELFYEAVGANISFEDSDLDNAAAGNLLYSKSRLYSYANKLNNNILYSYPNEMEFPITNVIELSASADREVTALVRWRNSLISATEHALYLSEPQGDDTYTRTLNTALGIPKADGRCCVPILNGVLFKSGTKIYQLYPNVYSDDSTTLNVTDISQSVSHYLEQYADTQDAFAFSTESEYVLMIPDTVNTRCLRYDYSTRIWTYHEYDVRFTGFKAYALNDIRLYGSVLASDVVCEYLFDCELTTLPFIGVSKDDIATLPYGDVITRQAEDGTYGSGILSTMEELAQYWQSAQTVYCIYPIAFELDTGQKTDTILTTKQFVETKLVFATLHKLDAFPVRLIVHVDGDPHIVTQDLSTDAPFWKSDNTSGVLNTTFGGLNSSSDTFNILRQLIVRYSGKGKSVRHVVAGESLCNFKLYETYIRYKLLNVKQ